MEYKLAKFRKRKRNKSIVDIKIYFKTSKKENDLCSIQLMKISISSSKSKIKSNK